jgi:hypothetical protein
MTDDSFVQARQFAEIDSSGRDAPVCLSISTAMDNLGHPVVHRVGRCADVLAAGGAAQGEPSTRIKSL